MSHCTYLFVGTIRRRTCVERKGRERRQRFIKRLLLFLISSPIELCFVEKKSSVPSTITVALSRKSIIIIFPYLLVSFTIAICFHRFKRTTLQHGLLLQYCTVHCIQPEHKQLKSYYTFTESNPNQNPVMNNTCNKYF